MYSLIFNSHPCAAAHNFLDAASLAISFSFSFFSSAFDGEVGIRGIEAPKEDVLKSLPNLAAAGKHSMRRKPRVGTEELLPKEGNEVEPLAPKPMLAPLLLRPTFVTDELIVPLSGVRVLL
jgi:hypothetical protein